jgi:hypothetical protein
LDKKRVGVDPNGYPIYREIPENTAIPITQAAKLHKENTYTITDHGDKTYTITENEPSGGNSVKKEKSTDELIAEARKYFPKQEQPKPQQEPKQTKFDKEIERSKKEWDYCFAKNPSKIPYKLPNLFDKNED